MKTPMENLARECVGCNICVKECGFLKKHGSPGKIANDFLTGTQDEQICFECSLCGLCASLCPKALDPSNLFLAMRRNVFAAKGRVLPEHKGILAYEKKGISKRYSLYKIPERCSTVFFPGCAFAGTRAGRTQQIYSWLQQEIPDTGMVLDCCTKPSHDLGRQDFFKANFSALEDFLIDHGVQTIITVCPNCHKVFSTYSQKLVTRSVYEVLAQRGGMAGDKIGGRVTIHDPCVSRFETNIHTSVRRLIKDKGLEIQEMEHCREKTICCGEGGSVFSVTPGLASNWGIIRKKEAGNNRVITYCAGCAAFLGKSVQTDHILDLLFEPEKTMACSIKKTSPPFTYLSRIHLKKKLKQTNKRDIRKKAYLTGADKPNITVSQVFVMMLIAAGIAGARMAGVDEILNHENIQNFVQGFGPMAPLVFMTIVCLAPAFFLPGAPFIIAGGLIFGPLWGVIYGITGATTGACLAFLVARYLASEWVESKLTNPSLLKLKNQTETHGWKIVAFTRLVPLFPFNLLSYALGLTKIRFTTYAITSFVCMLPGCLGYILLSSSLLDLLQGKFSMAFFAGMGLILLLTLMPILLKRFKPENL